jgi:hypothetical protein
MVLWMSNFSRVSLFIVRMYFSASIEGRSYEVIKLIDRDVSRVKDHWDHDTGNPDTLTRHSWEKLDRCLFFVLTS